MDPIFEQLVKSEKNMDMARVLRPLSSFYGTLEYFKSIQHEPLKKLRKGLALCHGHNHSYDVFKKIKFINYWYLVDKNSYSWPDYICDAADAKAMSYFPDNFFDCVLTIYCPAIDEKYNIQFTNFFINIHRILKKNGVLLLTELPGLFYWFINRNDFDLVKKQVDEIIGKNNINKFKNESTRFNFMNRDADFDIYVEILVKNYQGENKEKLDDFIDKISIQYTKKILSENNFEFVMLKGNYLVAKPINK